VGVAVNNPVVAPSGIVADVGETITETRVEDNGDVISMYAGPLLTVTPFRVAFTKSANGPGVVPAVNVTVTPVAELRAPSVGWVKVHEYAVPAGHAAVHVGVAVNAPVVAPSGISVDAGEIVTETRAEVDGAVIWIDTGAPIWVTPFRVAFTKSDSVPGVLPAVKVTSLAVSELRDPIDGWVTSQTYVVPEGQTAEQTGVAVMASVVCPSSTVAFVGDTIREVRTGGGAWVTCMATGALCSVDRPFSVALTNNVTLPAADPAVNSTGFPWEAFRVPTDGLVRLQE
jgi:hypothetical protein